MIAFLGPEYTYSYIAAKKYFSKDKDGNLDFISCDKIEDVVESIDKAKADYGLIPFWNSSKYHIQIAQEKIIASKNISIVDNFKMTINVDLLSNAVRLEDLKVLYSKQLVFTQCDKWLSKYLPKAQQKEEESTALGIKKALKNNSSGALAAGLGANKYGIKILVKNIQNRNNATMFFVLRRGKVFERHLNNFTLLSYPLVDLLKTKTKVNSLLMENLLPPMQEWPISIQRDDKRWYFLEIPGHPSDMGVMKFMGSLRKQAKEARILGNYPKSITDSMFGFSLFDAR